MGHILLKQTNKQTKNVYKNDQKSNWFPTAYNYQVWSCNKYTYNVFTSMRACVRFE